MGRTSASGRIVCGRNVTPREIAGCSRNSRVGWEIVSLLEAAEERAAAETERRRKRRAELDSAKKAIKKLVAHLDRQKDEAIMRTFRGVAKHFREVYRELVPGCDGALTMLRRDDEEDSELSLIHI